MVRLQSSKSQRPRFWLTSDKFINEILCRCGRTLPSTIRFPVAPKKSCVTKKRFSSTDPPLEKVQQAQSKFTERELHLSPPRVLKEWAFAASQNITLELLRELLLQFQHASDVAQDQQQ